MRKKYILLYTILLCFSSFNLLFPQQFLTKYYTEEEGLPDGLVNDIVQDQTGKIWFATRSGIGIYDGNNWTYHDNTNGLTHQNILKLKFDRYNRPWVLSSDGSINISYFDKGKWNKIPEPAYSLNNKFKFTDLNVQIINEQVIILVGTKFSGLFVYRHGYWSNFTTESGLPSQTINSVEFYNNEFYIATPLGAVKTDADFKFVELPFLEEAGKAILLFKKESSNQNKLWVMGINSIGYIEKEKFLKVSKNEAASDNLKYYHANLIPNYYNAIVYSYSQSLIIYEKDSNHSTEFSVENGLPQIGATSLYLDREMNIWLTSMRGVTKISSMRFANYNKSNGLLDEEVTAINEVKKGRLIFGHNNGFTFFENGKFDYLKIIHPYKKDVGLNRVLDITVDKKGNAYFAAAETGFGKIGQDKKITWLNSDTILENAYSIEISPKGEIFCLTMKDLFKYETGTLKKIKSFNDNKLIGRKIFFDNKYIYIVTSNKGVAYSSDYENWNYYKTGNAKEVNNVYSFFNDDRFGKLVGSEAGLFLIEADSLKRVRQNNFEINRPVYFIAKDTLNNLWFGTNNGVVKWDGKNKTQHYTTKTGLVGYETNRDAGFMCSKGCIWIGTDKGASQYLYQFDDISRVAAPVVLVNSIIVNGDSLPGGKKITIPYSNNDVTFSVSIISLIDEKGNKLNYKLAGYDKNWLGTIDFGSNFIRYTNLPPGEFSLALKGVNVLGKSSDIIISNRIIIQKPYYQSYWFYLVLIIFLAFLGFIGFKQFERMLYSKKLEKEVRARTIELKESENKYKSLLANLQDGFFVLQDGHIKLANNALAKMLGYELSELLNMEYDRVIAPEDHQLIKQRYNDRQAGKDIETEYEFKMLHNNGNRIHVNMNVNLSMFEGKLATIGTIKDITERKRNEDLLKRLSTAVNQSPNIVVITDQYGVVEYVNPMFTEISGYKFNEIKNRNINIVKSGLMGNEIYDEMWETIKKGDVWKGELINKKKTGELYWVRSKVSPIISGQEKKITHYLATQEDITFEKYANEELQKGEKLITAVLNNVPVMIFAFDKEANIYLVNGKILETLGFTQEMVIGKSAFQLFAKSSPIINDLNRAINGESFTCVRRIRRHTFEVTYAPMFNAEKKYTGTLGVAYNITDRKKYEADLIKAKELAEKSDRLKSEFLAQMSHEIRTPINSILSFTTLLKEELKSSLPDDLSEGFGFIENGAKRLIRTIDLILNMSQVQTGTYQPYYSQLDLDKDILRNIITEFKGVAAGKKIELIYSVNSDNNLLKGDSYTLGQIFANLVDNAIKYTPQGKVEVELSRTNGSTIVKVSDTGIGISSEFIPSLFTPFTQEESGYTRKFEGNGLGLALVKKYIEMNKADIKVVSKKGIGTSFIVTFNSNGHA